MVTVGDALALAAAEFRSAGVDSPRLAAEVLLAHVLGWERSRVIAHASDRLADAPRRQFQDAVRRHAGGEPLQYITGQCEFFGLPFRVSPAALIPRPETEFLVEKAVEVARTLPHPARYADVGTGSGCIAVSLAHEMPAAHGCATDLSAAALDLARENARRFGVQERVAFARCDLLEAFVALPVFDLILSNPPYVRRSAIPGLSGIVRNYEPHLALDGGESGLEVYRGLISQAAARLKPGGWLLLEIGDGQAQPVGQLLAAGGLALCEAVLDLQKIPRCLVARHNKN